MTKYLHKKILILFIFLVFSNCHCLHLTYSQKARKAFKKNLKKRIFDCLLLFYQG